MERLVTASWAFSSSRGFKCGLKETGWVSGATTPGALVCSMLSHMFRRRRLVGESKNNPSCDGPSAYIGRMRIRNSRAERVFRHDGYLAFPDHLKLDAADNLVGSCSGGDVVDSINVSTDFDRFSENAVGGFVRDSK